MITSVEVRTNQGGLLQLPLQDPDGGYLVKSIDGLDPVKANIVSSSFASRDGEQYQSSKREKRNILLKLGYEPDYASQSVRTLRNALYGFFMPKSEVSLRFIDSDVPYVDISGRVETFDSPLFAKDPEATISLLCMNPDFYDPTVITFEGDTVANTDEELIDYEGTVNTGAIFELLVDREVNDFTIYHRPPDNSLRSLVFAYPLITDDIVRINSVPGQKAVTLIRGGNETSILYGVSPTSSWLTLEPGENHLRVYTEGDPIPYTIAYTNKFGGL